MKFNRIFLVWVCFLGLSLISLSVKDRNIFVRQLNYDSKSVIISNIQRGKLNDKYNENAKGIPSKISKIAYDEININKMKESVTLRSPIMDAWEEIQNYNNFMDEIFRKMNSAIIAKNLDPITLKLMRKVGTRERTGNFTNVPSGSSESVLFLDPPNFNGDTNFEKPELNNTQTFENTVNRPQIAFVESDYDTDYLEESEMKQTHEIRGWLYGMSTIKRSDDISIFIHENDRTIQCPFSIGPLELKISKNVGKGTSSRVKTATATTKIMQGLMDLKIHNDKVFAEITKVHFDEPGTVEFDGDSKRRAIEDIKSQYKLILASKTVLNLKKVARLVVSDLK